jgi:hypothetical protein
VPFSSAYFNHFLNRAFFFSLATANSSVNLQSRLPYARPDARAIKIMHFRGVVESTDYQRRSCAEGGRIVTGWCIDVQLKDEKAWMGDVF